MKKTISLDGEWLIAGFEEGRGDWADMDSELPEGTQAIRAQVPGEVHTALYQEGIIDDPFYGANAEDAQWVEDKEWWYKRTIEVEPDFARRRTFLEFDGLDTYATVFFNGIEAGTADNMFIPHRFDVTELLHPGTNTVAVRFAPAARVVERMDNEGLFGVFNTPRLNVRKMQCSFGWDWTHRFVGAGIWRSARLVSYDAVSIADIRVDPEVQGDWANAWISVEVENHTDKEQDVRVSVVAALGEDQEKVEIADTVPVGLGLIEAVIRIEHPQLWWPNGFGEQTLYKCMVGIQCEGEVQDVAETRFGVRDVRLVERDDEGGSAFTLLVNGHKVFCKGGNWIPSDHFVSNVTDERLRRLLELAKNANFNMLRVWGGGIYEPPAFYDACDEMGIMVWQDFMFTFGTYPDDEEFCAKAAREVRWAVRHLRNHPCIVLWCGNNECEMFEEPDAQWKGKKIFHQVIPNTLRTLDDSRPYRASSPLGGKTGNDPSEGDWHGGSWFDAYLGDHTRWRHMIEAEKGRFVSEFGTQGPPLLESLREFIPEDKLFPPDNEVWEYHNKDNPHSGREDGRSHQQILVDLTRRMMGDFSTIEEFAAWAGILQGEFIKAEFEHYRREKWAISGALFWMYNDCWPAVGWSVVDYFLRPKIAYYYARRACSPVIVSFKQLEDRVQAYVTSDDRLTDINGTLEVGVLDFESRKLDAERVPVRLEANSSAAFWTSPPIDEMMSAPQRQCVVGRLWIGNQAAAKGIYFARTFAEMEFPAPKLLVERTQIAEDKHKMVIAANEFTRNLAVGNLPSSASISDNWLDLLPGEACEIIIDGIDEKRAKDLTLNVWRK